MNKYQERMKRARKAGRKAALYGKPRRPPYPAAETVGSWLKGYDGMMKELGPAWHEKSAEGLTLQSTSHGSGNVVINHPPDTHHTMPRKWLDENATVDIKTSAPLDLIILWRSITVTSEAQELIQLNREHMCYICDLGVYDYQTTLKLPDDEAYELMIAAEQRIRRGDPGKADAFPGIDELITDEGDTK